MRFFLTSQIEETKMSQGHIGVLYPRTYLSWCATARLVADIGKEIGDESLDGVMGLMFGDNSFIEIRTEMKSDKGMSWVEPKFGCVTGREEIESTSLAEVMDFLWYTHSMNEWPNV